MNQWLVGCPDSWAPEVQEVIKATAPSGFEVVFARSGDTASWHDLVTRSDFILAAAEVFDAPLLRSAAKARLIHKWGIGIDAIDLEAMRELGIGLAITAGGNSKAVAEHTIGLMLATLRRLPLVDHALREGRWLFKEMRVQCQSVLGKTVGIVGVGNIGRAVARRLQGFEADVIYYDPRPVPPALERELGLTRVSMGELIARSDIITLHCPGGAENRHLIDADTFARMRKGAVLINAARGELVAEAALVEALRTGHLMGAGLDVFEVEPMPAAHPLFAFENVVLSPHTAASVFDNVERVARHAFGNMQRTAEHQPIPDADLVIAPRR